jgi:IS5 family transposase
VIVDRHAPLDLMALLPELRLEMEPELKKLDGLLEDDELFGRVKTDLCQRYPNSARLGRRSTPVEVILRRTPLLVLLR